MNINPSDRLDPVPFPQPGNEKKVQKELEVKVGKQAEKLSAHNQPQHKMNSNIKAMADKMEQFNKKQFDPRNFLTSLVSQTARDIKDLSIDERHAQGGPITQLQKQILEMPLENFKAIIQNKGLSHLLQEADKNKENWNHAVCSDLGVSAVVEFICSRASDLTQTEVDNIYDQYVGTFVKMEHNDASDVRFLEVLIDKGPTWSQKKVDSACKLLEDAGYPDLVKALQARQERK